MNTQQTTNELIMTSWTHNNDIIYYSDWLEIIIKNHLAIKVFLNAVSNIYKIRNQSIL